MATAFDSITIGTSVELLVSGAVVRVCGVDWDDRTFMDETGAWHSFDDAVLA